MPNNSTIDVDVEFFEATYRAVLTAFNEARTTKLWELLDKRVAFETSKNRFIR